MSVPDKTFLPPSLVKGSPIERQQTTGEQATQTEEEDSGSEDGYLNISDRLLFEAFLSVYLDEDLTMHQVAILFNKFKKALDALLEAGEV